MDSTQQLQLGTGSGPINLDDLIIPTPLAVNPAGEMMVREYRMKCQKFTEALNRLPAMESIGATPDGNAATVVISHVEMTLDEMFFGSWDTIDFRWQLVANEMVGSLVLVVVHPVTGKEIKRTGAAAVQIMVDAVPEELKEQPADDRAEKARKKRERNKWAMNPENKKSNALDKEFPKLKAECTKNAAQSLGKIFGRDLNRKIADIHRPLLKNDTSGNQAQRNERADEVINSTKEAIDKAQTQRSESRTI